MAAAASAIATISSSSSSFLHSPNKNNHPLIIGSSVSSSSRFASLTRIQTRITCQQKDKEAAAVIPREQRWMFEESQINGPDIWNKTWYPKAADHITTEKTWYIVDATDKILGRLASTIAMHIRGKNLVTYTPSVDMGAYVIVLPRE